MIILENKSRLSPNEAHQASPSNVPNGDSIHTQDTSSRQGTISSYNSQLSLDQASISSGFSSASQPRPANAKDPNVFNLISQQGNIVYSSVLKYNILQLVKP